MNHGDSLEDLEDRTILCPHRGCAANAVIRSGTLFLFRYRDHSNDQSNDHSTDHTEPGRPDSCAACWEPLTGTDDVFQPQCSPAHSIHTKCAISTWRVRNRMDYGLNKNRWIPYIRCPYCRAVSAMGDGEAVRRWKTVRITHGDMDGSAVAGEEALEETGEDSA